MKTGRVVNAMWSTGSQLECKHGNWKEHGRQIVGDCNAYYRTCGHCGSTLADAYELERTPVVMAINGAAAFTFKSALEAFDALPPHRKQALGGNVTLAQGARVIAIFKEDGVWWLNREG